MNLNEHIGVCVKNKDGFILERNSIVNQTCGSFCGQICLNKLKEQKGENFDASLKRFNLFPKVTTQENHIADIVVTEVDDKIVTMIYPLDHEIADHVKKYEKYDLTASEFRIVSYLVKGHSNQKIADLLFISKSTLKKHLNNIYKKIPACDRPRV